jgi:O-antigen/teichoic acid export membrane protein
MTAKPELPVFATGQWQTVVRNLTMAASDQIDVLILNAVAGGGAASVYKVAKSLASLPGRLIGPLWSAVRPELLQTWYEGDERSFHRLLLRPMIGMLVVGVLALPAIWLAAPSLIATGYKIDGNVTGQCLVVLLVGNWLLNGVAGWYRFLMLLDDKKVRSLRWSVYVCLWIAIVGGVFGGRSALQMACVVACSQVVFAAAAVRWLLTTDRRTTMT